MKRSILKLTTATLLATAIMGMTTVSRAADSTTNAPAEKAKADKFYGPITAVDTNAMTFTVNDQTFIVTAKTQMTLAKDGSAATFAKAVVGESARGSYTKRSDGKLEVTKVRFGKKTGAAGGGKSGTKKKKSVGSADKPAAAATPDN
jgi:hypothetical protein